MPTINDLRQQAATIKNATQVGENTATRVGTTFETIADLLEGANVGQGIPSVDLAQLNSLRTPADQTTANPTVYNVTTLHNLSSTTIKVGTLFIFSDGGRAVVTQILLSNYQVDGGGNISSPNASQITMYYRMFNIVQETWSAWTLYAGGGGGGTIDPYPVSGSSNAVESNGVFEGLQKAAPEVNINDIDDLDDFVDMQTGVASTYTIKAYHNLSSTWLRVGVLMVFANQAQNTLTQICISNCMVDGGGNLIPNYTTNAMNVFYRFKQFSGVPPEGMTIGVWTTWAKFGDSGYQPDNEDIDLNASDQLQLANKLYDASAFSGLGRVYLRKNIVTSGGVDKNILTQAMMNTANTIYHIQYDYDLNGQTITLPAGCVLKFDGGSLANGTIDANGAVIDGNADIRTPLSNIGNGNVKLGWFAKSADASTALTRAMACANSSDCGIVDGGHQEYTLLTSIAVDKDNQCRLENLNLKFTASANGQSMFLFNEATQYAGNVLYFRDCKFEQTNPSNYQNVHCIHLRKFDSTTNGKIENVNVKNFSGYMFICESYLQECEFNLFKGQYVGGFMSFNKEYGTANAFGDYGQGSSNIINVVNSGIDNGLSVNNTITDIVDLSNNITATLTNCVWQGAASSKANFNAINISAYTNYRPVVRFTNCWVEYVGVGSGCYGLQVSSRVSIFTDRALGKMHVVGGGVYLELRSISFTAFSDFLEIENDTYPRIVFSGTMMLWDLEKKIRESDLGDKANFTFDCSDFQNDKVLNIYHKQGRVDDMLMRLLDSNSSSKKSLVFENGIPIVRQLPPDSGYNWTAITNMLRPMVDGKLYMYRIIFRVFPLEVPTSSNVNTFASGMTKKKAETNVFISSDNTVYCTEGQSIDPSAAEWHEVCVNPFAPANNNLRVNKVSAANVGFDIAVCELWEGFIPLEKDIEIDPTDATKLLVNKSRKPYSSASAPINPTIGFGYFNTSIGKELFWNGTAWVDALGNEVSNNPEVVEKETATSFNAVANTTYNINADASALVVTLPTISNDKTGFVKVFAATSAANGVTFAASGVSVAYKTPYEVAADKTYLFEAFWNGALWIVSANEIEMPLLPAGYTRKEYIQNTGDAWIDTGIAGQASTWVFDAQSTEGAALKDQRLFTGRDTGNMMYGCGYNRFWGCGAGNDNKTSFSVTTRKTGTITMTLTAISGSVDNETFSSTGALMNTYTFKLFNNSDSASTRAPFFGYLWSVVGKINDVDVFNGIPCTNPQGVAGLYDIVSKTFFPSIGTDQFVAGPDYVEPTE